MSYVGITQYGKRQQPSSAVNSRTPQWECMFSWVLVILNSIAESILIENRWFAADEGRITG